MVPDPLPGKQTRKYIQELARLESTGKELDILRMTQMTWTKYSTFTYKYSTLAVPFVDPPKFTSLDQIQVPDAAEANVLPQGFNLPLIAQQAPDLGAFLFAQPVPLDGAFCYLAVTSRPTNI